MALQIEINGKKLSPIREVASEVSYSHDYVNRLAREGKIVASLIGRQWFVDVESLKNYATQSQIESELRKTQLSEERKQELLFHKVKEQQEFSYKKSATTAKTRAVVATASVLALGLTCGVFGYTVLTTPADSSLVTSQRSNIFSQTSQTAANANALPAESTTTEDVQNFAPHVSSEDEIPFESIEKGILILPVGESANPADIFSDEVHIRTATSGKQTAVLVDADGVEMEREVPFVLVPVKTSEN
jgi:hypothetical protein